MISHKDEFTHHKFVMTGSDPVPVEICSGVNVKRQDMKTTREEADTMIVQQVVKIKPEKVLVVADDTDVFVLLLHFCCQGDIPASTSVLIASPIHGRAIIDINATVSQHRKIIPDLLAAHGLTGCDTVATYYGIGKAVALKVLRAGVHALSYIGDASRSLSEVTSQATSFILACYGQGKCTTLTEARQKIWASKVGRSVAGAPKLASLPPTNSRKRGSCSPSSGNLEECTAIRSSQNGSSGMWMVTGRSFWNTFPNNSAKWHPYSARGFTKAHQMFMQHWDALQDTQMWLQQCKPCLLSVLCISGWSDMF